jgi:hypothetical protein
MLKNKVKRLIRSVINKHLSLKTATRGLDYDLDVLHYQELPPFQDLKPDNLPSPIAATFASYNTTPQLEYLYRFSSDCLIEPEHGWLLLPEEKTIIPESHPYPYFAKPSSFLNLNKLDRKRVGPVISIWYEFTNYWHFHNDVLGQIALADRFIQDKSIPFLIPEKALAIPFVKEILHNSAALSSRQWLVQGRHTVIQPKEVYLVKNMPNTRQNLTGVLQLLDYKLPATIRHDKIYLKRGRSRGRRLTTANARQVEAVVKAFGYRIVDADSMSIQEQRKLFANAAYVIGLHGAGLTNLLFRAGASLHLTELFPGSFYPPHYFWLCNELGFTYDALYGTSLNSKSEFTIPVKLLEQKLLSLHNPARSQGFN